MTRVAVRAYWELRVLLRYRIVAVAAVLTSVWVIALQAAPSEVARNAAPYVLLLDTATFGSFFIAALYLFERDENALGALRVSPLRFREYLGVRVVVLTALSVCSAIPISLVAGGQPGRMGLVVLAIALLAPLFLLVNFTVAVRHRTVTGFLSVGPFVLLPLLAGPLVSLAVPAGRTPAAIVPTTGATTMLRHGVTSFPVSPQWTLLAVLYLLGCIVGAGFLAKRGFAREFTHPDAFAVTTRGRSRSGKPWRGKLGALLWIDIHTTLRRGLLVVSLLGPVLLALLIAAAYPALTEYTRARFGIDLGPYRPLLLSSLMVQHVPLMAGMVGALLVLDDLDDRKILVLRTSPITVRRYLTYRSTLVAVLALILLVVCTPICGLAPPGGLLELLPALIIAASQAPLIMFGTAAFAANKVEGLALIKVLGLVPTAIAPLAWWLPAPAHLPLMTIPHYWTFEAQLNTTAVPILLGILCTALVTATLARRTLQRLCGQ